MEHILEEERNNWEAIYAKLDELRQKIKQAASEPTYGLHRKKQMPFFRILKRELFGDADLANGEISSLVALTKDLYVLIEREIGLTGFWQSAPARNKLQGKSSVCFSPRTMSVCRVSRRSATRLSPGSWNWLKPRTTRSCTLHDGHRIRRHIL